MITLPEQYQKWLEFIEKDAIPSDIVYHYTPSWSALKNILETKTLWLTDIAHLNDTSEVSYAIKRLSDFILKLGLQPNAKDFFTRAFQLIYNITTNFLNFYTASFCTKENYLYSWRAYSNDGAGFAIGFKPEFFKRTTDISIQNVNFSTCKVFYIFDELNSHIKELIEIVNNDCELEGKKLFGNINDIPPIVASTIFPLLISIKDRAYVDEHEHRIYHFSPESDKRQKFFIPGKDSASPHLNSKRAIEFSFDISNISEIWVGPCLNYKHAEHDIKKILEKNNHINIIPSEIPYKNLLY